MPALSLYGGAVKRSAPPAGSPGRGEKTWFNTSFQGLVNDLLPASIVPESDM